VLHAASNPPLRGRRHSFSS